MKTAKNPSFNFFKCYSQIQKNVGIVRNQFKQENFKAKAKGYTNESDQNLFTNKIPQKL